MTKDKITIPAGTLKAGESITITLHGNYCQDEAITDSPEARELWKFLFSSREFNNLPEEK